MFKRSLFKALLKTLNLYNHRHSYTKNFYILANVTIT